jgi:hypothetical protein
MADFAVWATACEQAFWKEGTFRAAYSDNLDEVVNTVIEADLVGAAVRQLGLERTAWEGTALGLLSALRGIVDEGVTNSKDWPGSPEALSNRLRRAATFFRKAGVSVAFRREGKKGSRIRTGTRVTLRWPSSPRSPLAAAEAGFLRLANRYVWLNTHLTLTATWLGEERVTWTATDPAWSKWKPNNSTSPHWYSPERLRLLMAAEIALAEDRRQPSPSVREFVQQFRGLSSTVKASEICMKLGVGERETLADYFRSRPDGLKLLAAMQALSAPVKPAALGVLGREHLESLLVASGCEASSLIIRKAEVEHEGLPYVIEIAFGFRDDEGMDLNEGFNFTPAIGASPFRLAERLAYAQIEPGDPVTVFAHVASPRLDFLDRGKSRVSLPHAVSEKLTDMVVAVTAKWTKQKKAEIREHNAYLRRRDAMVGRDRPTSIKEAAYLHASANDTLPANPRQIMYAARPAILAATGKETLDSKYSPKRCYPIS